jgi:subtilisin
LKPADHERHGGESGMADSVGDMLKALGQAKVIVFMKSSTLESRGDRSAASALSAHFTRADPQQTKALVSAALEASSRPRATRPARRAQQVRVYPNLGLMVGLVDRKGLAALRKDTRVAAVNFAPEFGLIHPVSAAAAPAAPSWGLKRLGIPALWQKGLTGRNVLVGHLDTGVDAAHPALNGAVAQFAEFDMEGNPVPNARPNDSAEHGTHTAGTIAGRPVNGNAFGVAPEAQLACGLVIEGGQVVERVLAGMDWLVGLNVRILSMSLGLRGYTPAFETLITRLRERSVLPVMAVGNEGPNTSRSPGNYVNVTSVGAIDDQDAVATFSSSQRFARTKQPVVPDVVAPGVDILSCTPGNTYQTMSGSSMATPHIAGLAALLLHANPNATTDQIEQAILQSCSRPANMPQARGNLGIPDAEAALRFITQGAPLAAMTPFSVARRGGKETRRGKKEARRGRGPTARRVGGKRRAAAKRKAKSRRSG